MNRTVSARPWVEAWQEALYAPGVGFYRRAEGPAGHFATATHGPVGALLAEALVALAAREGCDAVVDVGAGRGELLVHLASLGPATSTGARLRLLGSDVVRPPDLPAGVQWVVASHGGADTLDLARALTVLGREGARPLVVAHEWLDVVPCPVVEARDGVWHEVLVEGVDVTDADRGPACREHLGGPVTGDDAVWLARWWPDDDLPDGARAEVGRPRDEAWQGVLDALGRLPRGGVALMVDYAHTAATRPLGGTFTAFTEGREVTPSPDGSADLTAHVALDSLPGGDLVQTQREAVARLLGEGAPVIPPQDLARSDPPAYLAALGRTSAWRALRAPGGWGDFAWHLTRR